jgi:hypothetical protein
MQEQYISLAEAIIRHQESVIGPLAWVEAAKVTGISVNGNHVALKGEEKSVLASLVNQYEKLFGPASVEACKDAVRPLLPHMKQVELPQNLQ